MGAVSKLEDLVGSTIAQQATLLLTSADDDLPRGWLRYETGAGDPYYYNAHHKVTTWHKPSGPVMPPPPPEKKPPEKAPTSELSESVMTAVTITIRTHNVAMNANL